MSFNLSTGLYDGYIYCIENRVNGKRYIGQTTMTIELRYRYHIMATSSGQYSHLLLYRAMQKYGTDKFSVYEIERISAPSIEELKRSLNQQEIYHITSLGTYKPDGYNMTLGGEAFANQNNVPVYQISEDGTIIRHFNSQQEADMSLGFPLGSVQDACNNRTSHQTHDTYWYTQNQLYGFSIGDNIGKQINRKTSVYQFTLSGECIGVYTSLGEARRSTGVDHSKISDVIHGKRKSAGGFIWSRTLECPKYTNNQKTHKNKQVAQMTMDGTVITTYPSATIAAQKLGLFQPLISKCCLGKRKSTGGYRWAFVN